MQLPGQSFGNVKISLMPESLSCCVGDTVTVAEPVSTEQDLHSLVQSIQLTHMHLYLISSIVHLAKAG